MDKAYIVHYVGYDYSSTDRQIAQGLTYELPDEIHGNYKNAVKKFESMVAEELQNWDLDSAEMDREKDLFHISEENPERWTEIRIKCLTIK